MAHNFASAGPGEDIVHGASRPGYPSMEPDAEVDDWLGFMQRQGIAGVCCLLDDKLVMYDDLLGRYREAFGEDRVAHVPVEDFTAIQPDQFIKDIWPFLEDAEAAGEPVVVHCSAGQGRTGQVLALWLVCNRDYNLDDAIAAVEERDRRPLEAVDRAALAAVVEAADC